MDTGTREYSEGPLTSVLVGLYRSYPRYTGMELREHWTPDLHHGTGSYFPGSLVLFQCTLGYHGNAGVGS